MTSNELQMGSLATDTVIALQRERRLVVFGLLAWLLRRYVQGGITASDVNQRLDGLLPQLGNVSDLWALALDATDHDVQERMGWSNWILFERENMGRAMFLDTDSHLWRAFLIAAVRRLVGNGNELQFAPTPAGRDVVSLEDSAFWRSLKEIREDQSGVWQQVLEDIQRGPALDAIARAAKEALRAQEVIDVDELIASPIDQERVAQVAREIIDGWTEGGVIRTRIEAAGRRKFENGPAPTGSHFGIYRLDRKDVYIRDSRLHSDGWGEEFGRGLSHGENAAIVNIILSAAALSSPSTGTSWQGALRLAIAQITEVQGGRDDLVVLLINAPLAAWKLGTEPGFQRTDRRGVAIGTFDGADVLEIHLDEADSVGVVIDLKRFGEWRRFAPARKLASEQEIAPGLVFGVAEVTTTEAERMLDEDRDLLARLGATTREGGIRELRRSVLFRLMEAFQYRVVNAEAAVKVAIPDEQH